MTPITINIGLADIRQETTVLDYGRILVVVLGGYLTVEEVVFQDVLLLLHLLLLPLRFRDIQLS